MQSSYQGAVDLHGEEEGFRESTTSGRYMSFEWCDIAVVFWTALPGNEIYVEPSEGCHRNYHPPAAADVNG
jgi:hypothetical protein